jgi:hypothetical protein
VPRVPVDAPVNSVARAIQTVLRETVEIIVECEQRYADHRGQPEELLLDHANREARFIEHLWYDCADYLPPDWWGRVRLQSGVTIPHVLAQALVAFRAGGYKHVQHVADMAAALSSAAHLIQWDDEIVDFIEGWLWTVRPLSLAMFPKADRDRWLTTREAVHRSGKSKRTIQRWKAAGKLRTSGDLISEEDLVALLR